MNVTYKADAVASQVRQGLLVATVHQVEALAHPPQVLFVERLEADEQSLAAARHNQLQEFFVVGRVDAGLTDPSHLQRDQRSEEFLGLIDVRGDVVVDEEDQRLLHTPDFLQDLVGRPASLGVSEVRLDGAELAAEMAASSRFHESNRKVTLAGKDRAVRPQTRKRRTLCLFVDALQTARREIV
jgi:hypothetical protein